MSRKTATATVSPATDDAPSPSSMSALLAAAAATVPTVVPKLDMTQPFPVGQNVMAQMSGDVLLLAVSVGAAHRAAAKPSKEGALCLMANSGGWKFLGDSGLKFNFTLGFANPNAPAKAKRQYRS